MPIDALGLFEFRYRDPASGLWVQSDHPLRLDDIAQRHECWQVNGVATSAARAESRRPGTPHAPDLWSRFAPKSDERSTPRSCGVPRRALAEA